MDKRLLDLLVCPISQAPLVYRPQVQELWCRASKLAYSCKDGSPVMLPEEARVLTESELSGL